MSAIFDFVSAIPDFVWTICNVLSVVSLIGLIFFSTKYRNGQHKPLWYILSLFFPMIMFIVFLVQRKEMNGAGMKQCPICHNNYPPQFVTCYKCNIELDEYDEKKSNRNKLLATVCACLFVVITVISIVGSVFSAINMFGSLGEEFDKPGVYTKISFEDEDGNKVYYDAKGNAYTDEYDVPYYTEKGVKYTYNHATYRLHNSDGKSVDLYTAYIDKDGYMVIDKDDSIYINFNREYFDENENEQIEVGDLFGVEDDEKLFEATPYYSEDSVYTDDDGNIYYDIMLASWTKDGKLITSDEY